ncbi:flagellar protein [Niallia taxi]|uniref:flagellar protein n=1 Tax=Niallia taxi TaxID=2499688 RepID=UPI0015F6F146|nr:flagellar protein [Niallia taxi]
MGWESIKNCNECGKVFAHPKNSICNSCMAQSDEDFRLCVQFLREQPDESATFKEMSEATGVSLKRIMRFVREGRFIVKGFTNLKYPCAHCGELITEGKYCKPCKEELSKSIHFSEEDHFNPNYNGYLRE